MDKANNEKPPSLGTEAADRDASPSTGQATPAFERAIILSLARVGHLDAETLSFSACVCLESLAVQGRSGWAYLQLGVPAGPDAEQFQGNFFLPSGSMTLCLTGSQSFVNALSVAIQEREGQAWARGAARARRLPSLPLCAVVRDDTVLVPSSGLMARHADRLQRAGWHVTRADAAEFAGVQAEAAAFLETLPDAVPRGPKAKKPKSSLATIVARTTKKGAARSRGRR
jgi:hypothetical protein